jgi:hypothetical protein
VMTIILSSFDTGSVSSVTICCTTVAIFNMLLLVKLGACTKRPVLRISCRGRCYCMGAHKLFPYVCGACGCWCLCVLTQCSCIGLLWWGEPREECPLRGSLGRSLCCSPFTWLQAWYDAGWGFSPSTRVQLQQLGVDPVFIFSGHSLHTQPPPHHKYQGGCLQLAQILPKFWQL